MKKTLLMTTIAFGALLGSGTVLAADEPAMDSPHPMTFVKDSAITTAIKTKLAAEHLTSLGRIHVDTDKDGAVWLSGSAGTQAAVDKAASIAKETDGVRSVHNSLTIKKDE